MVCIITGISLLFYPQIEKRVVSKKQKQLVEAFEQLGTIEPSLETVPVEDVKDLTTKQKQIKGARGIIRIPKIDVEMVIFEGSTEQSLSSGVGMIEPDKEIGMHNVGLAGHRSVAYGKNFNRLAELTPKDEIEIQTDSKRYRFIIEKTFVVDRKEVNVLANKPEPYVTLVTCTPIGAKLPTDRLIVQAKLKEHSP